MKIITWNVNGIRAVERKGEIQNLIKNSAPDILFMQEIKGTSDKFSSYLNNPDGYEVVYNSAEKAGYAGTGLWIKEELKPFIKNITMSFNGDPTVNEGRVIHLVLEKDDHIFDLFGIYFPNGWKSKEAWDGKLIFYKNFLETINVLKNQWHTVLWCGDINCAHHAIDLSRPKENDGKIGFHPLEREWLDNCEGDGWVDIWRDRNKNVAEVYSWWDPVTKSRERNVGWRIDAIWWEKNLKSITEKIAYLHEQYGSDHCPMEIVVDWHWF